MLVFPSTKRRYVAMDGHMWSVGEVGAHCKRNHAHGTKMSVLCSAHFEEDFLKWTAITVVSVIDGRIPGYPSKRRRALRLKPGSVPTLFEQSQPTC